MRNHVLALLLAASACAGAPERPDPAPAARGSALAELEASRTEVEAIRAAAADATAALRADEPAWEEARQDVSTPLDRDHVRDRLAAHARAHGLELSQFALGPAPVEALDLPVRIHPASPFPVRAEHALLEAPIRFALTPLRPDRIERFLRSLPEVSPLVIVDGVARGMDFVEVQATAPTFRPLDPAPRFALEMPQREQLLQRATPLDTAEVRDFEAGWRSLELEVAAANDALAALSEARLRHARVQAWAAAREKASLHAAQIALPPPARAGAPATRSSVP